VVAGGACGRSTRTTPSRGSTPTPGG
jgi:hypothetical protein